MPRYRIQFLAGPDQVVEGATAQAALDEYLGRPEASERRVVKMLLGEDEATATPVDAAGNVEEPREP